MLPVFEPKQLDLIRRTCASDCNNAEFDTFISICKANNLNPLNREIYGFVFNKGNSDKRQLTPVVSIDGLRKIGERTGNYRPDDQPPRFEYDKDAVDENKNPAGIISCTVTVYKHSHGDWHPAPATVYWDEFVPLNKQGIIDWGKKLWREKPRIMIAKVAEAQALRKAFPDNFGNLYAQEEYDQSAIIDITPSEAAEQGAKEARQETIGSDTLFFQPLAGKTERVHAGKYADRVLEFIEENKDEPSTIIAWRDLNRPFLQDFWVKSKNDALEIKKLFEGFEKQVREQKDLEPEMKLEAADAPH